MNNTRADRIYEIIKQAGGRMKVSDIYPILLQVEKATEEDVAANVISPTVRADNKKRRQSGKAKRFTLYREGEEHGYISIAPTERNSSQIPQNNVDYFLQISSLIEIANQDTRTKILRNMQSMKWADFEKKYLSSVMEGLGFLNAETIQHNLSNNNITVCQYKRGLLNHQAIISGSYWNSLVGPEEIQRIRGIKSDADSAVIFTLSRFSDEAIQEAKPSIYQRSITLIDGSLLVDTCIGIGLGVKRVALPVLYQQCEMDRREK